jgi:hypothetical protein
LSKAEAERHLRHITSLDDMPSSYKRRPGKAHQAFVRAAFVVWQAISPWLSIRCNHFADKLGVENMPLSNSYSQEPS